MLTSVDESIARQLSNLLKQHVPESPDITMSHVQEMIHSKCVFLFVAKNAEGAIVGMSTLIHVPKLDKLSKTIIEDVVVDVSERGKGIGEMLTKAAIDKARDLSATQISLTSSPKRIAANGLYQKLGFEIYSTNYYTKNMKDLA